MKGLGYNTILIRDCTLALETSETIGDESMKKRAVNIIEILYGPSTTSEDIRGVLEGSGATVQMSYVVLMFVGATIIIFLTRKLDGIRN